MPTPTQLRDDLAGLTRLASNDLSIIWRQVRDAANAEEPLRDVLPALVDAYGSAAGTLAVEWYDDFRAELDIPRAFRAIPARIDDHGTQALVGWALSEAQDFGAFQSLIEGGMQRRILNEARFSITGSSIADPMATGWQRAGRGGCGFCAMLIGRGSVYTEAGADFASHDHCRCSAVPAFEGHPLPVKPFKHGKRRTFNDDGTVKPIPDAERIRVNEFIKGHNL